MTMSTQPLSPDAVGVLRQCPLFRFFPTPDLERFSTCTRFESFQDGQVVCAKGTSGDRFYLVVRGSIEITDTSSSGESLLRVLNAQDFFGEIACLEENGVRTANARARGSATLLAVPRDEFLSLVRSHPEAAVALVRELAARVRHYTDTRSSLVSPNEYEAETESRETMWHRIAGVAERWAAHWSFIALNLALWGVWLGSNGRQLARELPTISGLTMWLSVQAIVMTTLVLVAQKRADEKERRRRDLEFQWASATMDRINQVNDRLGQLERLATPRPGSPG